MIILHGFGPAFGVADASPFVLKVDLFLRISELEYKVVNSSSNLQKAPKGKLPFITDGEETIADSYFIFRYLQDKYNVNIDKHLSDKELSLSRLLTKSLDENFYWCIVYSRWIKDDAWLETKETFFGKMPFPLKVIIPIVARKGVQKSIKMHGIGRHSEDEILQITKESLQALSILLEDKPYFFGDTISSFDVTAYSMIVQFAGVTTVNEFTILARTFPNLVAYCQRITSIYYSTNE